MSPFSISAGGIDLSACRAACTHPGAGAFASFEGWVRDVHQGRAVRGLDYQAYAELAEVEGTRIIMDAMKRFDLLGAMAVHRVGTLTIGDLAVYVGVSSGHRDAAFAACRHIIDAIKAEVPIWKREHYVDGDSDWLHPLA